MEENKAMAHAICDGINNSPDQRELLKSYPLETLEHFRDKVVEYNDPELDDAIALINEIIAEKD